jgi:hypothetical protein
MGKKNGENRELFDTLRATGLRKKIARTVSVSAARVNDEQSRMLRNTAQSLRTAASAIENHVSDDHRRATGAAKKPRSGASVAAQTNSARNSVTKRSSASRKTTRSGGPRSGTAARSQRGTKTNRAGSAGAGRRPGGRS